MQVSVTVFDVRENRREWKETIYQGGTTGERFVQYLKETLLPTLRQGDIVVMDNMRSHHVKAVREILEAKGMNVLYLPPYSPDLNPKTIS